MRQGKLGKTKPCEFEICFAARNAPLEIVWPHPVSRQTVFSKSGWHELGKNKFKNEPSNPYAKT